MAKKYPKHFTAGGQLFVATNNVKGKYKTINGKRVYFKPYILANEGGIYHLSKDSVQQLQTIEFKSFEGLKKKLYYESPEGLVASSNKIVKGLKESYKRAYPELSKTKEGKAMIKELNRLELSEEIELKQALGRFYNENRDLFTKFWEAYKDAKMIEGKDYTYEGEIIHKSQQEIHTVATEAFKEITRGMMDIIKQYR